MIDIALIKRTMKLSFKDDCMADNQFEHIEKNSDMKFHIPF